MGGDSDFWDGCDEDSYYDAHDYHDHHDDCHEDNYCEEDRERRNHSERRSGGDNYDKNYEFVKERECVSGNSWCDEWRDDDHHRDYRSGRDSRSSRRDDRDGRDHHDGHRSHRSHHKSCRDRDNCEGGCWRKYGGYGYYDGDCDRGYYPRRRYYGGKRC